MFAQILSGHILLADWLFLIGAVFALFAAIAASPKVNTPTFGTWAITFLSLAAGFGLVGWLVL